MMDFEIFEDEEVYDRKMFDVVLKISFEQDVD